MAAYMPKHQPSRQRAVPRSRRVAHPPRRPVHTQPSRHSARSDFRRRTPRRDALHTAPARFASAKGRRRKGGVIRVPVVVTLVVTVLVVIGLAGLTKPLSNGFNSIQSWFAQMLGDPSADPSDPLVQGTSGRGAVAIREKTPGQGSVTIDLVMVGDVLQHTGVYRSGKQADGSYNFDHVFSHIVPALEGVDVKVLNQETPLGGAELGYTGYPSFNGPQEMGDAEVTAGFNVILKATNHAMDRSYAGIHNELEFWHEKHPDVAVLGERDVQSTDPGSLDNVYIYKKDGFKVALLNYTYGLNGIPDPQGAVSLLDEGRIRANVMSARLRGADIVVAFPHWGTEYVSAPTAEQHSWAEVFRSAGVDVIIGGHPHVIGPVEMLGDEGDKQTLCFWSVGNFICTQSDNSSLIGGMAKLRLVKDSSGHASVWSYHFLPLVIDRGKGMTTYLLRDWTDALASQSSTPSLTPAWAQGFCSSVLGDAYDTETSELSGTMFPEAISSGDFDAADGQRATSAILHFGGTALGPAA